MNEHLIKASHSAQYLLKDLQAAHKDACYGNQLLEMLLIDMLEGVAKIVQKLETIEIAVREQAVDQA